MADPLQIARHQLERLQMHRQIHSEMLEEWLKYVYMPKVLIAGYQEDHANILKGISKRP